MLMQNYLHYNYKLLNNCLNLLNYFLINFLYLYILVIYLILKILI